MVPMTDFAGSECHKYSPGHPIAKTVEDLARRQLRASVYVHLHRVECNSREGVVTLRGRVPSYFLKQTAQELLRGIPGVKQILNQLEVG